jgi:hypothetical protein
MPFAKVTDRYTSDQIERSSASGVWQGTTMGGRVGYPGGCTAGQGVHHDAATSYTFGKLRDASQRLAVRR